MTVNCAWCDKFIYEKCVHCSGAAISIPKQFSTSPQRYRCPKGHPTWIQGRDAGTSHGICVECNARVSQPSTKPVVSRRVQ